MLALSCLYKEDRLFYSSGWEGGRFSLIEKGKGDKPQTRNEKKWLREMSPIFEHSGVSRDFSPAQGLLSGIITAYGTSAGESFRDT